jgi:cyanophycin synthetase
MAQVKRRVIDTARRRVVLNADDPICRRLMLEFPPDRTAIFSFHPASGPVQEHLKKGGIVYCCDDGAEPRILRIDGNGARPLIRVSQLPAARGGLLPHNIANAMAAAALADGLGVAPAVVRSALSDFQCSPEQLPGRFNVIRSDPFLLIVDQAMSPPAAAALRDSFDRIRVSGARACMMTTAGNRAEWHYREMAAIHSTTFDRFICYEIERYRRGRAPGEIAGLLRSGLLEAGVHQSSIEVAPDYLAAFRALLSGTRPGDLALVFGSFKRDELLELQRLSEEHAATR